MLPGNSVVSDDVRALADSLAGGRWPTADVRALREHARRCREIADAIEDAGADLIAAHRKIEGVGHMHSEINSAASGLADGTDSTTQRGAAQVRALADTVDRYADLASTASTEMTVIAAIAERDRVRGELMAQLGDDSARVMAASGGRLAMTTAGDEYVDQAGNIDTSGRHHDDGQPPPAATSGMMPFAALGGLAAAGVGMGAAFHQSGSAASDAALSDSDVDWLRRRADQLQSALGLVASQSVRMAVGVGVAEDGSRRVVVGTSEPYPYLYPGATLANWETLVGNGRDAELAIVDHMTSESLRVQAVAAATPMAPSTAAMLESLDADSFAPAFQNVDEGYWTPGLGSVGHGSVDQDSAGYQ